MQQSQPIWVPNKSQQTNAHMALFQQFVSEKHHLTFANYQSLHQWSIEHPNDFWQAIWDYGQIKASQLAKQVHLPGKTMRDTKWFTGAQLNYAENLLQRHDDHPAIIFANEIGNYHATSFAELHQQVACLQTHFIECGIQAGDRIAAFMPNCAETVVGMLAATALGAIWSSCSPDFGLQGLLDRLGQIEPKILLATNGHYYRGKHFSHIDTIQHLQTAIPSIQQTVLFEYLNTPQNVSALKNTVTYQAIQKNSSPKPLTFTQLPFDHPLFILYSSGTTGKPKCLVHGAGNTLIQHTKELMLHSDLHRNDTLFFYTTCGWMMWNWMVSSLAIGATIVLFDGSPLHPRNDYLFDLIDQAGVTHFGCGAKYIETIEKETIHPMTTHHLTTLRCILTTASPLLPKSFDYVYQYIKQDVCLSSISGGSDIISCFALGNRCLPVYRGELQCKGLGMAVDVFNANGQSVAEQKGELVCTKPFPSMPLYFWNDHNGQRYQQAYFDQYPNIWAHGDYAEITKHHGMIIYGRSDTTLNPGGIRIGTAEIYRQVDKLDEVVESLACGHLQDGDEQIILFVVLRDHLTLDNALIDAIKQQIRKGASPRHVPTKIFQAPELPRTVSGKVVEIAVKNIINGQPVKNITALANPESLDYFKKLSI